MNNIELLNTDKPIIVAEIGQAHDGSLGLAHAYIDAVAKVGVDVVKFQTHIASEESTLNEPFRIKFSKQDNNRFDYWKRMEFTEEQWKGLAEHAKEKNIIFLSSAFSSKAIEILKKIDIPAWKIGSGEFWSNQLFDLMIETGKPLWISTGMSSWKEIDDVVAKMQKLKYPFSLLQCTSRYPTDLSEVGINVISEMKKKYGCTVGLSDHSGSIFPSLQAMACGAKLLEVHVTFNKGMFGPDTSSSLTIEDLSLLVKARDAFFQMNKNPVDKDVLSKELSSTRALFSKSIALKKDLSSGSILREEDLITKKPGTGISIKMKEKVIGKKLKKDVNSNCLLSWKDFE